MGDMVDLTIEDGNRAWVLHQAGECGEDWCQYCEEEEMARYEYQDGDE